MVMFSGCTPSVLKTGRNLDAARSAVSNGDVNMQNSDGDTPLHYAAGEGNLEVTQYLVDNGANIEAANKWGNTPILAAVIGGHMKTTVYLVEMGADLKVTNEWGITPLISAASYGTVEIVKLLIANGADIEAKSSDGDTALIWASRRGHVSTVKYLIEAGADKSVRNFKQKSAYSIAQESGREDIMALLSERKIMSDDGAKRAFAQAKKEDTISAYEHFQAFYPNNPPYTKEAAVLAQKKRDALQTHPEETKKKLETIKAFLEKEDLEGLIKYVDTLKQQ